MTTLIYTEHWTLPDPPAPALYITGFTGTRRGLTKQQKEAVTWYLLEACQLHHGDCVGADEQAQSLARNLEVACYAHPGLMERWRAHTEGNYLTYDPKPELQRDRDIARVCDRLLACPAGYEEETRSGTWATARYGHAFGKPVLVIYPDGTVDKHWKPGKVIS
jgi:hypothetical protein